MNTILTVIISVFTFPCSLLFWCWLRCNKYFDEPPKGQNYVKEYANNTETRSWKAEPYKIQSGYEPVSRHAHGGTELRLENKDRNTILKN